jgi:hypothetical protein
MIEEEYVSFDTAKLAKEKGFRHKSNYFYLGTKDKNKLVHCAVPEDNNDLDGFTCVTQSLLARWLREKHDISVAAYRTWAMDNSYNYEILVGNDFDNMLREECECNRTYEKAMENGLKEALKLI